MTATSMLAAAAEAFAQAVISGGTSEISAEDVNAKIVALIESGPPQDPADPEARTVLDLLDEQSWDVLWDGLGRAAARGPTLDGMTYLEMFRERIDKLSGTQGRAHAAMLARLLLEGGQSLDLDDLATVADLAAQLLDIDPADALEALERLGLDHVDAEGTLAMLMATAVEVGTRPLPANVLAMVPAGYTTRPWDPPPSMGKNIGRWIGQDAHTQIAAHYAHFHKPPGHTTWFNHHTVEKVVDELAKVFPFDKGKLTGRLKRMKGFKPDIMDFSLEHVPWLYEIKPAHSIPVAKLEAEMYQFIFNLFNVPVITGPPAGADTSGWAAAPGGIYVFGCPVDGAIGYHYIRAPKAKLPEGSKARKYREAESRATESVRATGIDWEAAALALVVVIALVVIGWIIVSIGAIAGPIAAAVASLLALFA